MYYACVSITVGSSSSGFQVKRGETFSTYIEVNSCKAFWNGLSAITHSFED